MDPTDEKLWVKVLLTGCPLGAAVDGCPLEKLRAMSPDEARRSLSVMDRASIHSMLQHHRTCRRQRESAFGTAGAD